MLHPSIRLEGSVLSADILDAIERGERSHQLPKDFGLEPSTKVKDEIADAWAAARAYWAAYQVKISRLKEGATGTTETRNQWLVPLLGLLSYQLNLTESETLQGKTYRISHRDPARDQLPVHLIGWHESLDRRSTVPNAPRMSPHGLVQEYLNLTEHLYGIVSNGRLIRLLRDSSRLVKLTFIEFDLERIFTEELFADFALFYRLLHASRLPVSQDAVAEAPIEIYHQDSLESGSRIRDGLSTAVHRVILDLANGLLNHPANHHLRELAARPEFAPDFYAHLLRLIYRLLFLMVIEERGLAHVPGTDKRLREIYDLGYSLARLRKLSEKPHFADARHSDAWLALIALFRLVDESGRGLKLGVAPLGGDLFNRGSLGVLEDCSLDNATFLGALRQLTLFTNPVTRQIMRVNYGALNVEEFGSVYQGLLEFEPRVTEIDGKWHFAFAQGDERAATGSHYTEDELVQPLLKHSLDHLIAEKLKQSDPAAALLSLRIADISCGSGHILLAAARRIGMALAIVRTGDDQPSPAAYREAVRDVIKNCIYGVDLNPLAVELCKVALWLEAHVPGEPLGFLDHHIKCGNAIVGFVTRDELDKGIPDEAFKTLPGDDKDIAAAFRKTNKDERKERSTGQKQLPLAPELQEKLDAVLARMRELSALPEHTPAEIAAKKKRYAATQSQDAYLLRQIAAIPIAQFYQPKTAGNKANLITDATFRHYLAGRTPQGQATASAWALAERKRAFHWFLEFPDIIANGGFDCILGNPPYLGGSKISTNYGDAFLNYVKATFYPAEGKVDLAAFFIRRIHSLLNESGYLALITTNSISQGDTRIASLEFLVTANAQIVFAVSSTPWPGAAIVRVSLISIAKKMLVEHPILNGKSTAVISSYLDSSTQQIAPERLAANSGGSFIGSVVVGEGFILSEEARNKLLGDSQKYNEVIFPYLGGRDLNTSPSNRASRWIINFFDWPKDKCQSEYPACFEILANTVYYQRKELKRANYRDIWWQYAERGVALYKAIEPLKRVIVIAKVSRTLASCFVSPNQVFADKVIVFALDQGWHFALLQSCCHYEWAWKYCTTMKSDLSYTPVAIYQTFPFPPTLPPKSKESLNLIGENYHDLRHEILSRLQIGLTKLYNLFHHLNLTPEEMAKESKQPADICHYGHAQILQLRSLHAEMDQAVIAAYGWHEAGPDGPAIVLGHDFHEVDYLPENDRTRYTITPQARKDLLTRLLKLNHARAAEEQNATLAAGKVASVRKTAKQSVIQLPTDDLDLFSTAAVKRAPTQPRELALPTCKRVPLVPADTFLLVFVHEFLSRAGDQSTLRNLDGVFHLLRHRKAHNAEIVSILGDVGEKWIKRFNDTLPNDEFIPFLKRLETQKWIEVDARTGTISKLPKFQTVPEDEWRAFDIEAALSVLTSRPEVLELVTATKDASRSTQAFGIIKTA